MKNPLKFNDMIKHFHNKKKFILTVFLSYNSLKNKKKKSIQTYIYLISGNIYDFIGKSILIFFSSELCN